MIALDLVVTESAWKDDDIWRDHFERILKQAARELPRLQQDLTVAICLSNDEDVRAQNAKWRGRNQVTNVLAFPASGPVTSHFLGDIILAHGAVQRESLDQGKSMIDHVCHLFLHGLLHLLGYDHQDTRQAEEMESVEIKILHALRISNPYA